MSTSSLPTVPFGDTCISRLVLGANPINGGSHLSRFTNRQMKRYFTAERIFGLLRYCESLGINTWQSCPANIEHYALYKEQGGTMHYISLGHANDHCPIDRVVAAGALAIAHHGEETDKLWKAGRIDQVQDYCKKVRDAGILVGVSTHMPAVIDHILCQDWDLDFFMCCLYERHRTRQELIDLLGHVPIPIPEVYLESDPERMFSLMRETEKPCLAFKILAAGRLCETQETVEQAFKETFTQINRSDSVIIGMYPEYEDQPALNAEYVKRFHSLSS